MARTRVRCGLRSLDRQPHERCHGAGSAHPQSLGGRVGPQRRVRPRNDGRSGGRHRRIACAEPRAHHDHRGGLGLRRSSCTLRSRHRRTRSIERICGRLRAGKQPHEGTEHITRILAHHAHAHAPLRRGTTPHHPHHARPSREQCAGRRVELVERQRRHDDEVCRIAARGQLAQRSPRLHEGG